MITNVYQLERTLSHLGSHYFDADTKKFFGSKVLEVKPTKDGAIFRETMRKPGWVCVRQLVVHGDQYELLDLYKADNTPVNARQARRVFDTFKENP